MKQYQVRKIASWICDEFQNIDSCCRDELYLFVSVIHDNLEGPYRRAFADTLIVELPHNDYCESLRETIKELQNNDEKFNLF